MKANTITLLLGALWAACVTTTTAGAAEDRAAWMDEARFGMFIHWGLYAELGRGEWVMNREKIPVAEYEKLAAKFNPVKFDADQWVQIAKRAGMKYIVITSKHHDGFAMFGSKVTPYNIVDATPFKRDPLKELAAMARGLDRGKGPVSKRFALLVLAKEAFEKGDRIRAGAILSGLKVSKEERSKKKVDSSLRKHRPKIPPGSFSSWEEALDPSKAAFRILALVFGDEEITPIRPISISSRNSEVS